MTDDGYSINIDISKEALSFRMPFQLLRLMGIWPRLGYAVKRNTLVRLMLVRALGPQLWNPSTYVSGFPMGFTPTADNMMHNCWLLGALADCYMSGANQAAAAHAPVGRECLGGPDGATIWMHHRPSISAMTPAVNGTCTPREPPSDVPALVQ